MLDFGEIDKCPGGLITRVGIIPTVGRGPARPRCRALERRGVPGQAHGLARRAAGAHRPGDGRAGCHRRGACRAGAIIEGLDKLRRRISLLLRHYAAQNVSSSFIALTISFSHQFDFQT